MKRFHSIFDLLEGTDAESTIAEISQAVKLRGYNLWILVCSAMLASIGLNTNSVAVIIGAMLISPLMSPILGIGLSIGIHDKELFIKSVRNFGLAIVLSLGAAWLFFMVTPLKEPTSELVARTYPTLLDVLVAVFGGIAGIVSMSRREKTNAIPGVAIATALMPPLCAAGYGLARWELNFFFGAFYLFVINAIFISMATLVMVKYLEFPEKQYVNKKLQKLYSRWFALALVIVIAPSIYFLYNVYRQQQDKNTIQTLVIQPMEKDGVQILKWEVSKRDSINRIKIYFSGPEITGEKLDSLNAVLIMNRLNDYEIIPYRMNITKDEVNEMSTEVAKQIMAQMSSDLPRSSGKKTLDTASFFKEIEIAMPFIDSPRLALLKYTNQGIGDSITVFQYKSRRPLTSQQQEQLNRYVLQRLGKDSVAYLPAKR